MSKKIAVVGAGISGLSCAWLLANKDYSVRVFAKAFSPNTTSNRAAAFWFPYHIRNDIRGINWCHTSYNYYQQFSANKATGVSMQTLIKVLRHGVEDEEPVWIDFMPEGSYRIMGNQELKKDIALGYDIKVPLIETQIFLPWLMEQLIKKDVIITEKKITDLNDLANDYDAVINCTGLGSQQLCKDKNVFPVRGQVALIAPEKNFNLYLDNEMPLYIVPRKDAIIIGGTYEEHVYEEITEPNVIEKLLANAYSVFPQLKNNKIIGSWAGLRPYRNEVRVEHETDRNIIHNYGHGGSGFTLAFGCAEAVLELTEKIFL